MAMSTFDLPAPVAATLDEPMQVLLGNHVGCDRILALLQFQHKRVQICRKHLIGIQRISSSRRLVNKETDAT